MHKKYMVYTLVLFLLCNSCATQALWNKTNPNARKMIKFDKISEEELKERGVKYVRSDKQQVFYVDKDSFSKFKDYTVRIFVTPFTIVFDTTLFLTVGFFPIEPSASKISRDRKKSAVIQR